MHPDLPFTVLPAAVLIAWFAAPEISASSPGRYQVARVQQIEDPSALMEARAQAIEKPDIRVQVFLPHKPPKPPMPEPELILQSVVVGDQMRLATINGRNLQRGDRVEGYVVRRITTNGVDLAQGQRTRHLPMRPLHELPTPTRPSNDSSRARVGTQNNSTHLTKDFWRIFDALKP